MKSYKIGDNVLFYVDVTRKNPVAGEIVDITDIDFYKILYEGSQFGVYGKFIVGKIVSDKEVIQALEEKILHDEKKLQVLDKRIVEADAEISRLKKKVAEQKNKIIELERDTSWRGLFDDNISYKDPKWKKPVVPRWGEPVVPPRWRDPLMCKLQRRMEI